MGRLHSPHVPQPSTAWAGLMLQTSSSQMGLLLQALRERTARRLFLLSTMSLHSAISLRWMWLLTPHWGFELLIDTATCLRTGVTRIPVEDLEPSAHAQPTHAPGCLRHGGGLNVVVRFWRLRLDCGPPPPADACARSSASPRAHRCSLSRP